MRKTTALLLITALVLGGCGTVRNSRLNPMNWFGGAQETQVVQGSGNALIPRGNGMFRTGPARYAGIPVDQVTGLVVERIPGGAIIRVEALADRQGSFNVKLVPETDADEPVDGLLAYTLAAEKPGRSPVGTAPSRRIVAAHFVSDDQLAGTRTIRVSGARNALTSGR